MLGNSTTKINLGKGVSLFPFHTAALAAVEKLHTLAAEITRPDDRGRGPSVPSARAPSKAPKVQPSGADDGPTKTIQVGADPS
jgi:hypothetical protein